ncbi:type II secretion system F family protein [Vibrio salinus]|uniref:type II secretion system F family protein n=1 Tax=Vibrio salinus TaxID=2899784 RepID=UPI001E5C4DB9|nr:type II secretion system F family protein [Vibrio salinus]MCE0494322.1 type II secretion system F family protein [Vibrio salinus]
MQDDITIFLVLLFFAVVFISQALLIPAVGNQARHKLLTHRLKQTEAQLDEESRSLLREFYLKSLSPMDRKLVSITFFANMQKKLEMAGLSISLSRLLGITLAVDILICLTLFGFDQPWYVILFAFSVVWIILNLLLDKRISDRLTSFEEQLPEALDIMRRMLQAGMPISQAMGEVGNEMPEPIGSEFKKAFNLLNFGYDMRLAIMQMAERTPTVSILAFSSAVLLQKETGGNLSENLEKVSRVLRARFKLQRKIKTISAESRMSAWILILAPFILFLAMTVIQPDNASLLYKDPRGIKLITFGVISLFFGALWMRKIINFEV